MDEYDNILNTEISEERCEYCGEKIKYRELTIGPMAGYKAPEKCLCVHRLQHDADIRAKGFAIIRTAMRQAGGIDGRRFDAQFDKISPRPGQERVYQIAKNYAEKFWVDKPKTGLYFNGAVGCGKTMLSAAIANSVIDGKKIDPDRAYEVGNNPHIKQTVYSPVQMISMITLLSRIQSTFGKSDEHAEDIIKPYMYADLTIIDDLGAEKHSAWVDSKTLEILDYRYNKYLPIIITTNLTTAELCKNTNPRIYDRLKDMCDIVSIEAPSQRGRRDT